MKNIASLNIIQNSKHKSILGFTLAEVLITLGIIGIVSAMTIPTLVQNHNTKAWNTATNVFNRKLEEALKIMNSQATLAGHVNTKDFVVELSRHFKTNKICDNEELLDCFSDVVWWGGGDTEPKEVQMDKIKLSMHFGQISWGTELIGTQFANGTSALIAYNPNCTQDPYSNQITGDDCLAILYDTSGNKNPNTKGKDLQGNGNVTKLSGCAFEIENTCYSTIPFKAAPLSKTECESLKSSHGIKSCLLDNDYWAGAVKACGGVDKLPTKQHLAQLANYLYNTTNITSGEHITDLTLDTDKAKSLGFTLNSSNSFFIWADYEYSGRYAYIQYFYPTYTMYDEPSRTSSSYQTICLD